MSVYAGPEIVSDSLVFAYDMANTQKSWKGAPTTNLATGQTLLNHSLVTLPTFSDAPEKGVGWKKVTVTATSSNFRMLKMDAFSVAANSTTTYSIEFECSSPEVYLNIDGTGFGGGAWTKIGATRYSRTVTTASAGQAYLFINSNTLNASVNYVIYYKEYQIESGSFATPYVVGTRSTTQAIVDLTGSNIITANSLTYASDNTFSFVGPNNDTLGNYISLGNPVILNFGTGNFTLSFLTYRTADGYQGGSYVGKGDGTSIGFDFRDGSYFIYGSTGLIASMGFTASNNVWQYHSFVFDRTTSPYITYYRNGIAFASSNVNNSANILSSIDTTRSLDIGRSQAGGPNRYFNGKMPHVQIYNRALSASEIKQNFNATRSRYGI